MKFIDVLVETLQQGSRDPRRAREILYFLVMDQALRSKTLSERKSWEIIGSLIAYVGRERHFPKPAQLKTIKSSINSLHRDQDPRTSEILVSLRMFELGEAAVKKFLMERAWKGFPGVTERGKPLK